MKPISPHTRRLIDSLRPKPRGLWGRLMGRRDDPIPILDEIESAGEPGAIPFLLHLTLDRRKRVARRASEAVAGLLRRLKGTDLAQLDELLRVLSPWSHPGLDVWYGLRKEDPGRLRGLPNWAALVGLASCHPSGYVREEAVRMLGEVTDGTETPFLLLRLNDWVWPVRTLAYALVKERLRPDYADQFVEHLALVLRLEKCGRERHGPFVRAVMELLKGLECRASLRRGLWSSERAVSRACFRLLADSPGEKVTDVLAAGLESEDPIVRLWAARKACSSVPGDALQRLLAVIRRDRFMPVRRDALCYLASNRPDESVNDLRRGLLDLHPSVREAAQYYVRKITSIDVAQYYRDVLASAEGRRLPAAIEGLGETGDRDDAESVVPYLDHRLARVRRAALRALNGLDGDGSVQVFLKALTDERSKVSREARKALSGRLAKVGEKVLWDLFLRGEALHVRKNALALVSGLSHWTRIPYLVRACTDADEKIAARAVGYVRRWVSDSHRVFTRSSSREREKAEKAIREYGSVLDESLVQELRFMIR